MIVAKIPVLYVQLMDNLHNRLIFDLGKSIQKTKFPKRSNLSKVVKFQNLVAICSKIGNFLIIVLRTEIVTMSVTNDYRQWLIDCRRLMKTRL